MMGRLQGVLPRLVVEVTVVLVCLSVVVMARGLIDVLVPGVVPFALLYPAVLLATLLAGWRAGTAVMLMGGAAAWYAVLPPSQSFAVESAADAASLALFFFACSLVTALAQAFRHSAAALGESEARFRQVAETAPVKLWMGDETGACLYLNRAQREFWGLGDDISDFDWTGTLVRDADTSGQAAFARGMANHEPFEAEARYRRADGAIRTLATRAQPRFGSDGRFLGMIGVNVDVTDARSAERRQRLLLDELNHRVKNTLASVQSLAYQTLRSEAPARALEAFTSRLVALAKAHDILTLETWESALLSDLVGQTVRPYQGHGPSRFSIKGPRVRLGPRAVLALAMALHELTTNALKYGALSIDRGQVSISWRLIDDHRVEITWRETGGPPVIPPERRGFGSRLLNEGLIGDLGAAPALSYEPSGVVCVFTAPVAETALAEALA